MKEQFSRQPVQLLTSDFLSQMRADVAHLTHVLAQSPHDGRARLLFLREGRRVAQDPRGFSRNPTKFKKMKFERSALELRF